MRDLKKALFTLNLGALIITYNSFFDPLAKEHSEARFAKIEAGRKHLNKIQKTSEEAQQVIDQIEPAINNGMPDEGVKFINDQITIISHINEKQQDLGNQAKSLLTDKMDVIANQSVVGSITEDEKVRQTLTLVDQMKQNSVAEPQIEVHKQAIMDYISRFKGSGSSNFTDNITQLILEYQDLISSLSLIQKLTIINMLTGVLILNCLLTLIAVFYGESLITYFNLEHKFPRLTKFIKLRSKLQQFYFLVNSIIIIIAIVVMIYANYLMFIHY